MEEAMEEVDEDAGVTIFPVFSFSSVSALVVPFITVLSCPQWSCQLADVDVWFVKEL
jgi:hypothetical protein